MAVYRNLVFKGGGVKGSAYVGALEYLYRNRLMRSVQRTAGTSAGAITAAMVSLFHDDFDAFRAAADSLDYAKVPSEEGAEGQRASELERRLLRSLGVFKSIQCVMRLVQDRGWYSSGYLYGWLRQAIASRFAVAKESYSFADFRDPSIHKDERPFLDLYVTGTDITNRTARIFSYETTPDMEVASAVRISMSIPLYFEGIEYRYPGTDSPQAYADGGVLWNYPIGVFDDEKYGRLRRGINEETLGFFLYTSPESTRYGELKGLVDYIGALFESLLLVQDQMVLRDSLQAGRTIFIDDMGVLPTRFDIGPGSPEYGRLLESGRKAAEEYFAKRFNFALMLARVRERFGWKL